MKMEGRIIIAALPEDETAFDPRPGETASAVSVDTKLYHVSTQDRFTILNAVLNALKFTNQEIAQFLALRYGGGMRSETYTVDQTVVRDQEEDGG